MPIRSSTSSRFVITLSAVLLGCGADDGVRTLGADEQPIINGRPCEVDEQAPAVAVMARGTFGGRFGTAVFCSGTLIAPDTVLTAAHCVDSAYASAALGQPISAFQLYVSYLTDIPGFGPDLPAGAAKVKYFEEHPAFTLKATSSDPFQHFYDLALLFLEEKQTVTPAFVIAAHEDTQIVVGAPLDIAGWGIQSPNGEVSGQKRCARTTLSELGEFEMRVGGDATTSRQCHGDSGGPAFMDVETTTEVKQRLVGVTSRAYDSGDCASGGVNTRLDKYRDWIDTTLKKNCGVAGRRISCKEPGLPTPYPKPKKGCGRCGSADMDILALLGLASWVRHRRRVLARVGPSSDAEFRR